MDVNPYESPKTSAEPEPAGAPGDALRTAIVRLEPWATLAGLSVLISGAALILLMLIGARRGDTLFPVLVFGVGAGLLATRLIRLGRAVRSAAVDPARLEECFRQLRKVFSYTGILGAIYMGLILLVVIGMLIFVK